MNDLLRDLWLGFRSLRRRPLLLATTTLTLGLGLGAGAAVFSVIEAALLQPLPFQEPDRLAIVWGVAGPERDIRGASPIEIEDWDAEVDALGPLSRYVETTANLSGTGGAAQLEAELVGVDFFRILGVAPIRGRSFVPEDDEPGAAGSVVISHDLWESRFGGEDVLGRTVVLDDIAFSVVGVMPEGFRGLSFDTEVWVPLGPYSSPEAMADRGGRYLAALGRLAPGATEARAQDQLSAATQGLAERFPDTNRDRDAMVVPIRDYYVGQSRALLLLVLAGVGLLLLIACANVANIQLVRAIERRRDVALRYALGAGRFRVGRVVVAESLIMAALGAVAGSVFAWMALQLLLPVVPPGVLPAYAEPEVDGVVLGATLATALVAGLLFALIPALRAGAEHPALALRGGNRVGQGGWRRRSFGPQQAVIVVEVALALLLLVTAGLAFRSLQAQLALDPGFEADRVLVARVSLTPDEYDRSRRAGFAIELVDRVGGLAGVRDAAAVSAAPLRGYDAASYIFRAEDPVSSEHRIRFYYHSVTPDAFAALGIPIVEGRGITTGDREESNGVAVVSEAFAEKVWPGEEAVGRSLTFGGDTATVVGVAGNVRYRTLTTDLMDPGEDPDVYFAYAQVPTRAFDVVARVDSDPAALTGALRRALAELDTALPLFDVATLESMLDRQTALDRMVSTLFLVFGTLALLVAGIGLYGVLAFAIRRRRREIAVRTAVGAEPRAILRLVVGQGLLLAAIGVGIGVIGALLAGRLAASLLFGVAAIEPVVLVGTGAALLAVAGFASWLPARHAVRIEPRSVLAEE